jgi:hypothetical protein
LRDLYFLIAFPRSAFINSDHARLYQHVSHPHQSNMLYFFLLLLFPLNVFASNSTLKLGFEFRRISIPPHLNSSFQKIPSPSPPSSPLRNLPRLLIRLHRRHLHLQQHPLCRPSNFHKPFPWPPTSKETERHSGWVNRSFLLSEHSDAVSRCETCVGGNYAV